jgi:hypothetical protein
MEEETDARPGEALSGERLSDKLSPSESSACAGAAEYLLGGGCSSSSDEPNRSEALNVLLRIPKAERVAGGDGGETGDAADGADDRLAADLSPLVVMARAVLTGSSGLTAAMRAGSAPIRAGSAPIRAGIALAGAGAGAGAGAAASARRRVETTRCAAGALAASASSNALRRAIFSSFALRTAVSSSSMGTARCDSRKRAVDYFWRSP